jgi:SAM-dependent methyltransferase
VADLKLLTLKLKTMIDKSTGLENTTTPAITYSECCTPFILDACCGSRMFWFDKNNPNCLFIDKRSETVEVKDSSQKSGLRTIEVKPDLIADFTEMPFEDESFAMVVFDPPHLKTLGQNSWMAKKYGRLPKDWEFMIAKGFDECMRVLKPQGTLIFKWNEHEIKSRQVLDLIPYKPLFGHTSGKQAKTIWMAFMKGVS